VRGGDGGAPADGLWAVDVGVGDVGAVLAAVDLGGLVRKAGEGGRGRTLSMASLTRWVVIRPFFQRLPTRSALVLPVERQAMVVARVERRNTGCVMKFLSLVSCERIFMGSSVHEGGWKDEGRKGSRDRRCRFIAICGVFMCLWMGS
jgi:hypothetical protein